jgi:diguanylate cyclase (GGDEF)-like protein/PAS domain S-box-containing protein
MGAREPDVATLIRDLQKAKETIRELEDKTRLIIDSIHAGIIVIDIETHKIIEANPEALRLMGSPKDQVIGKICHNYICPAEVGSCPITDKGQEVDNSERFLLMTDGRRIPILKTVTSINLNGRKHLLESFLDITQLKLLQDKLEILATTDPLTGIFNRRHFIEMSTKEFIRARRTQTPLSIAMIDIDNFKNINDRYGHTVGDLVLKELISICKDNLRPYDILGRLGGEEFAITAVSCTLQEAYNVSERLRKRIAKHIIQANGKDISIKISVGVAELSGDEKSWDSLLYRADQALYLAKKAGRNRVKKSYFRAGSLNK